MGALQGDGSFGFRMRLGNDGGAAALGVRMYALIDGQQVSRGLGDPVHVPANEEAGWVSLNVPREYVAEVRGRGAPTFTGKFQVRAVTENGAHEAWWPDGS
jgi:hypothetical protein